MKAFFSLFMAFAALDVAGQSVVSGKVTDRSHNPIPGVNVYIKDSYDGTTSAVDGTFSFKTTETGEKTIIAQAVGFTAFEVVQQLGNPAIQIDVELQEQVFQLSGVVVKGTSEFAASNRSKATVLKRLDVLTTAGSNADITMALQTLPGTQQVGEQEGLFVRGGTGKETKVYVDGMPVNDFYYKGTPGVSQRGRFSPDLFKGSFFSTGGYSALYGQALSSTLILESEDLPLQSNVEVTLSSVGANAGANFLSKNQQSSVGGTIKYSNLSPYYHLVKQNRDFQKMPEFTDGTFHFRTKTSSTGILKFYGAYGYSTLKVSDLDLDNPGIQNLSGLNNSNVYTNLSYKERIGKRWKMTSGLSFSINTDDLSLEKLGSDSPSTNTIQHQSTNYQARTVFTTFWKDMEINFGGDFQYADNQSYYNQYPLSYTDQYSALFAESRFTVYRKLKAQVGLRAEYSSVLSKTNLAPRSSLAYELNKGGLITLSYGQFYQNPDRNFLLTKSDLNFTKSKHYILSFQKVRNERTFRTEIFYKQYENLIKTSPDTNNTGSGYAKGFEVFWRDKKSLPGVEYWVSYSFLDTKRDYLNYPRLVQPDFAAKHTVSLVTKKYIPALSLITGFTYTFSSGRPYYNPNRPDEQFLTDQTKNYHNVNAMLAYLRKVKGANAIFVVSLSNILGTQQVFGYSYSTTDFNTRKAITPLAKRFLYFSVILNWGIDKRQQAINDAL